MRLFIICIVSDSGYATRTMNVVADDAEKAIQKGLARYLASCGGCARVVTLRDEGSVTL
jgi:hypothetical protein